MFSAVKNDYDVSLFKKFKLKKKIREKKEQESLIQLSLSHVNSWEFPESNVFIAGCQCSL